MSYKLVKSLFSNKVQKKSTRAGFGDALLELGKTNKDVVGLCADLTESVKMKAFAEKYPERYIQCGVAEQNMVAVAAGLAVSGKIPFASTFGVFFMRAVDQIRISVCYNKANVKLAASHTGITVGEDGATHQALEDIAVMRSMPGMTVVYPADYWQTYQATLAIAKKRGPCYLRFGRLEVPMFFNKKTPFNLGKVQVIKQGKDVTVVACGIMVYEALKAAYLLRDKIDVEIINCHTLKPIDKAGIIKSVRKTKAVVTAEEHQVNGGLGSAVAEVLVKNYPAPQEMIAIQDTFGESGQPEALMKKYHLTARDIVTAIKKVIKRK
jgi:transketolase